MNHLYTTKVTAVGGRSGSIKSEDGILDLPLAMPKELGGKGGATNPEQLFAAGYAACFENAVIHVSRAMVDKVRDNDIEVTGEVGLLPNGRRRFQSCGDARCRDCRPRTGESGRDCAGGTCGLPLFERDQGQCRCCT